MAMDQGKGAAVGCKGGGEEAVDVVARCEGRHSGRGGSLRRKKQQKVT